METQVSNQVETVNSMKWNLCRYYYRRRSPQFPTEIVERKTHEPLSNKKFHRKCSSDRASGWKSPPKQEALLLDRRQTEGELQPQ